MRVSVVILRVTGIAPRGPGYPAVECHPMWPAPSAQLPCGPDLHGGGGALRVCLGGWQQVV